MNILPLSSEFVVRARARARVCVCVCMQKFEHVDILYIICARKRNKCM